MLEPPGSSPQRTRDGCPQGCSPAPHLPEGHRDGVRCAAHLPSRRTHLPRAQVLGRDDVARSASAVPGGAGVAKLEAVGRMNIVVDARMGLHEHKIRDSIIRSLAP